MNDKTCSMLDALIMSAAGECESDALAKFLSLEGEETGDALDVRVLSSLKANKRRRMIKIFSSVAAAIALVFALEFIISSSLTGRLLPPDKPEPPAQSVTTDTDNGNLVTPITETDSYKVTDTVTDEPDETKKTEKKDEETSATLDVPPAIITPEVTTGKDVVVPDTQKPDEPVEASVFFENGVGDITTFRVLTEDEYKNLYKVLGEGHNFRVVNNFKDYAEACKTFNGIIPELTESYFVNNSVIFGKDTRPYSLASHDVKAIYRDGDTLVIDCRDYDGYDSCATALETDICRVIEVSNELLDGCRYITQKVTSTALLNITDYTDYDNKLNDTEVLFTYEGSDSSLKPYVALNYSKQSFELFRSPFDGKPITGGYEYDAKSGTVLLRVRSSEGGRLNFKYNSDSSLTYLGAEYGFKFETPGMDADFLPVGSTLKCKSPNVRLTETNPSGAVSGFEDETVEKIE